VYSAYTLWTCFRPVLELSIKTRQHPCHDHTGVVCPRSVLCIRPGRYVHTTLLKLIDNPRNERNGSSPAASRINPCVVSKDTGTALRFSEPGNALMVSGSLVA
jgi:hypothetical protein